MDTKHLGQKQRAARWSISETSLERWLSEGIGPKFLKLPSRVLYRQVDIEALGNWVRLSGKGRLTGAGDEPVSPEQMELARLTAELAKVKMERDILKNCPR